MGWAICWLGGGIWGGPGDGIGGAGEGWVGGWRVGVAGEGDGGTGLGLG